MRTVIPLMSAAVVIAVATSCGGRTDEPEEGTVIPFTETVRQRFEQETGVRLDVQPWPKSVPRDPGKAELLVPPRDSSADVRRRFGEFAVYVYPRRWARRMVIAQLRTAAWA
jgi:hypothetical protein